MGARVCAQGAPGAGPPRITHGALEAPRSLLLSWPGEQARGVLPSLPSLCANQGVSRLFLGGARAALTIGRRGHNLLVLTCQLCCQLIDLALDVPTPALAFSQPQFTTPLKRLGELNNDS